MDTKKQKRAEKSKQKILILKAQVYNLLKEKEMLDIRTKQLIEQIQKKVIHIDRLEGQKND